MPSQRHIDVPNQIIRVSRADTYSEYSQYARSEEDYSYNESYHGLDHESHCGCYDCHNVDEDEEDSSYYSSHDSSRAGDSLPANVTPISPPSRVSRRSPHHNTSHSSSDSESAFEDGHGGDGGGGPDDSWVEAYHDYVCLWLAARAADLVALGFERVPVG
jgi:hypothetical protein